MSAGIHTTKPFQVFPYTVDQLAELFAAVSPTPKSAIQKKWQFDYFESYFGHFEKTGPITIVVEWKYTDRDFLEDFASYYVRCFQQKYSSICARVHFFHHEFDESRLRGAIEDPDPALLKMQKYKESYLGFVVVKRLPFTFIGRTCLKTYEPEKPERRCYPVVRPYNVHLLGLNLTVTTLAFQEQDTVTAACATSALWSALQSTAHLFQHEVRSPIEITRIATEQLPSFERDVPNHGLAPEQMAIAIKRSGLEPEVIPVKSVPDLQATAYAYLRAGIPLVMNTRLFDVSDSKKPKPFNEDWESAHAVAVTGYSLGNKTTTAYRGTKTLLKSSRIDKLYVHDDQIGPFARIEFGKKAPLIVPCNGQDIIIPVTMKSSWRGGDKGKAAPGTVLFGPETLIIPLYHKIRIRIDKILPWVLHLDDDLRKLPTSKGVPTPLEWDIFLTTGAEVKSDIRGQSSLPLAACWRLLERPLPRFLWRATALAGDSRFRDYLFDATDINQGDLLIETLIYNL